MSAKEEILARARLALADVPDLPAETDSPVAWQYGQPVDVGDVLEDFVEKVIDYKATVVRCDRDGLAKELATAVETLKLKSAVVPDGLDASWVDALRAADVQISPDGEQTSLSHTELNAIDAVVTAAAVGAAETGTIVLDHSADQGRRALTLVPDAHICVIRADQVVSGVPEAITRLKPSVLAGQPLTWISGGSATSDIELSRVEGVHGPRTLYVIVVE